MSLYEDKNRSNKEVKKLTIEKINEIDQKLKELTLLRKKLSHLADNCKGNGRPDCPILDELSKLQKNHKSLWLRGNTKEIYDIKWEYWLSSTNKK